MIKEHEIRRAWEGFIENGTVAKAVRQPVVASWQRCQSHGIPFERNGAPLASEGELVQCRSAHAAFVEAAQGALKQARLFLSETDSMLMLTDPSGLVLETAGDPRTIDFGRHLHLEQGGRWSETNIGTNAIGTALATLEPVQIHGGEHFCREVQLWTCAATPIWHPHDRELLGLIDISGPARTFTPQSLAFAVAVGRQIESAIAQAIKYDHERLLRYFLTKRSLWLNEDVVAIDHRGTIVYGAESALQNLERRHRGLTSEGRISFLKSLPATAWPVRLSELVPNSSTELVIDH